MFGDFDLDALMRQAQQMQADLERAQREVSEMSFTGEAGGDLVSVTLSGQHCHCRCGCSTSSTTLPMSPMRWHG